MNIKLERKALGDGCVMRIVMYRKHWWSSWKPFRDESGNYVIHKKPLSKEEDMALMCVRQITNSSIYTEEETKVRLEMLDMVAWSENVYVGAMTAGDYTMAYDTPSCSFEDLQNLEIKEG